MSNNRAGANQSNEANPEITIEELFHPKISVDKTSGYVYLFFGKTPRAQLSIKFQDGDEMRFSPHAVSLIEMKFPMGKVTFQ